MALFNATVLRHGHLQVLSSYTGVTDRRTDSLVEFTVKCSHSKAHAAVRCTSDIYSAAMETVQSSTGGQGSLWRTDRRVSRGGGGEDRRQRENGEEMCCKLVFVRGKGVADALQKMAENNDRTENRMSSCAFTSRLCFVQTDINSNQQEVWNECYQSEQFGDGEGCNGDSGVDDEGWRWLTAVLTTSCELVPISCGVTVIFFGVSIDQIQIRHRNSLF